LAENCRVFRAQQGLDDGDKANMFCTSSRLRVVRFTSDEFTNKNCGVLRFASEVWCGTLPFPNVEHNLRVRIPSGFQIGGQPVEPVWWVAFANIQWNSFILKIKSVHNI
jgi:flagellar basal body rod protein FlgF